MAKTPQKDQVTKTPKAKAKPKTPVEKPAEKTLTEPSATPVSNQKKYWYLLGAVVVALIAVIAYMTFMPNTAEAPANTVKKDGEKKSNKLPRALDGVQVAKDEANAVPVCVMIENAAFGGVRPQSGLSEASIVYEIIVEGGITRLMAVFPIHGENTAIGPVRSARDTYLEFASELDCAYTHAGGSFTAMQAIPQFKLKDIDALREGKWFERVAGKAAPHDLFTDRDRMRDAVLNGHSWKDESTFDSWIFEKAPKDGVDVSKISIAFGGDYDVEYNYNADTQVFERKNGGVDHTDEVTGNILTAKNVVIQHVPAGELLAEKGRINFSVTGEGKAEIFRNGKLVEGTWKKADRTSRTKYYDANGDEVTMMIGNSWVEIVPEGYSVSWDSGAVTSSATPAVTGDFDVDETAVED